MEDMESTTTPTVAKLDTYTQRLHRFVELDARKRVLEPELDAIKKEMAALGDEEGALFEDFVELGQQNVKLNGVTVYLKGQIWAGAAKRPDGSPDYALSNAALREAGVGELIEERFNAQVLSSWVRELPRDDSDMPILPPSLAGKISVAKVTKLVTVKR